MTTLRLDRQGPVVTLTINRPKVRNAFNAALIEDLREAFAALTPSDHVVVLTGAGKAFCAGADLAWMQASATLSEEDNVREATTLANLFRSIDTTPRVVIGRVNGLALGGGVGLLACCDIAVSAASAEFAFSEVRLGLAPAVISPFVVRKIGRSWARRYFLTGERFDAATARLMGLVHDVVDDDALDDAVGALVTTVLRNGPQAMIETKQLVRQVTTHAPQEALDYAIQTIARLRTSPEGQEGVRAFLEKRAPRWP